MNQSFLSFENFEHSASHTELADETKDIFLQVLPTLGRLGAQGAVIEGRLPADHVRFPGQAVLIAPYQTDRHATTAAHKIQIGTNAYRLSVFADDAGQLIFDLSTEAQSGLRPVQSAEAAAVGEVLTLLPAVETPVRPPSLMSALLRKILRAAK